MKKNLQKTSRTKSKHAINLEPKKTSIFLKKKIIPELVASVLLGIGIWLLVAQQIGSKHGMTDTLFNFSQIESPSVQFGNAKTAQSVNMMVSIYLADNRHQNSTPGPTLSSGGSSGGGGGGYSFSSVPPAPVQNIPTTPAPIAPGTIQNPIDQLPTPANIIQSPAPSSTDECVYLKENQQSTNAIILKRLELAALKCAKLHKSDACMFLTFNRGTKNTYVLSKFAFAQNACDKKRVTDPCGFVKRYTGVNTALAAEVLMAKKECKKAILNFEKSCLYVNTYKTSKNKKIMTTLDAARKICLMYKAQDPCGFSKKFNADQYSRLKSEADDAKQMCVSITKNVAIKKSKDSIQAAINSPGDIDQYALQMIDEAVDLSEVSALSHTPEEVESLSFTSVSIEEKDMQSNNESLTTADLETADFDQEDRNIFDAPESAQVAFAQTVTGNTEELEMPQRTIFRTFVEILSNKIVTSILLACMAAMMVFYVIIRA